MRFALPHVLAALLITVGCQGAIRGAGDEGGPGKEWVNGGGGAAAGRGGQGANAGGGGASGSAAEGCDAEAIGAGPAQLRRLLPNEYANTARALLDDESVEPRLEPHVGAIISAHEVEVLSEAAEDLAAHDGHARFAPCDVEAAGDDACARGFIAAFGKVAFRRPLDAEEEDWLHGVYEKLGAAEVTPAFTFAEKLDALAEVTLQAPQHVYLHERGEEDDTLPEGVRKLSGYERAARLSYLMASSTPDEMLMAAADSGELATEEGVRVQVERLLDEPAAREMVRAFASSWLKLNDTPMHPSLEKLTKNEEKFPNDTPELRSAMRIESERLYERAFFEPDQSFATLLTDTSAYVDGPLAQLYGVEDGPSEAGQFEWVQLPADERAGIFTRAAFLTSTGSADYQSPVLRGVHLYRHVLCQPLPDPPANVDNTPPEPSDASTPRSVRQLFEAKTSDGSCQGCHGKVNPVGFAFEHYDALGQFQTREAGELDGEAFTVPVDSAAQLNAGDLQGEVADAVELSRQLAQSAMAHDCMVDAWFERLTSREPSAREHCALDAIKAEFQASSDLRALVLRLASSDSALFIEEDAP